MEDMETIRYNYKIRPGAQALADLEAEWHRSRFLWNEAVHMQRSGQKPTFKALSSLLTTARARFSWLAEGSSVAQNQTLRTYDKALRDSFKIKGRGRPKIKKRHKSRPSLQYTLQGFRIKDGVLRLPHGISIPVVWSRELPSKPTSVRIYQDSLNDWYASFVVQRESVSSPLPDPTSEIGIDWGITTTAATTSPAHDLPYQGHRKRCQAELAKSQRKMARRKTPKGTPSTNGYNKARRDTAKIHKKAARQAQHTGRMWAKSLVRDFQFIAIEDLKLKFIVKSTNARKEADASIGIIKATLIEYAERAGRTVVKVPPAYTTQTCSKCLARAKRHVERGDRVFLCDNPPCEHKDGRDRNAAKTVLQFARASQAGINLASAEGVRQWKALKSQLPQPDLGIPAL